MKPKVRGAGKSSLINKLFKLGGLQPVAKTGDNECTTETQFYDATSLVKKLPKAYTHVFIVDQPGRKLSHWQRIDFRHWRTENN